jgi:hypothetical protein
MVQGHTFYVLLSDAVREEGWYGWHSYVHGYTAPAFLFGAGLAFGITTFPKWAEQTRFSPATRRRLVRYLTIIGIGYLLHLPSFSLVRALQLTSVERLERVVRVDALQHIGVSLMLMQLLAIGLRRQRRFVFAVGAIGAAAVLAAPYLWRLPATEVLPLWLAAYVNADAGSVFPIAPWCGFICAGILTAHLLADARRQDRELAGTPRRGLFVDEKLALLAAASALTGVALNASGFDPFGEHNFWKTSPYFFLRRLGTLFAFLSLLCVFDRLVLQRMARGGRALKVMGTLAQETLIIYVVHLLILYGSPVRQGLHQELSRALGLWGSIGGFLLVFVVSAGIALAWNTIKTHRPPTFAAVRMALAAVVLYGLFQG